MSVPAFFPRVQFHLEQKKLNQTNNTNLENNTNAIDQIAQNIVTQRKNLVNISAEKKNQLTQIQTTNKGQDIQQIKKQQNLEEHGFTNLSQEQNITDLNIQNSNTDEKIPIIVTQQKSSPIQLQQTVSMENKAQKSTDYDYGNSEQGQFAIKSVQGNDISSIINKQQQKNLAHSSFNILEKNEMEDYLDEAAADSGIKIDPNGITFSPDTTQTFNSNIEKNTVKAVKNLGNYSSSEKINIISNKDQKTPLHSLPNDLLLDGSNIPLKSFPFQNPWEQPAKTGLSTKLESGYIMKNSEDFNDMTDKKNNTLTKACEKNKLVFYPEIMLEKEGNILKRLMEKYDANAT